MVNKEKMVQTTAKTICSNCHDELRMEPAQTAVPHSSTAGAFTVTLRSITVRNVTRKKMRKNE